MNFRGRGSNPRKRAHYNSLKKKKLSNYVFQLRKWRKYCKFTDIVALKANNSYCCFLSRQRKEGRSETKPPEKV